jgi:apolipoprotein N-acyltransferase
MWRPFGHGGAALNITGPGVLNVAGQRVGVLICYEEMIVWPVLTSMLERPTVLVGIANDYWCTQTSIPAFQAIA